MIKKRTKDVKKVEINYTQEYINRNQSGITIRRVMESMGAASLPKTLYRLNNPALGLSSILMWFQISNKGVTNNPSK